MGWFNYYKLFEKYDGDLSKASKLELDSAAKSNPNNPYDAKKLAEEKWRVASASKRAIEQSFPE